MLQKESYIKTTDNTDSTISKCIGLTNKKKAGIGDVITVSIKKTRADKTKTVLKTKIKKKQIHKLLIINTKKKYQRIDGDSIEFLENTGVLITIEKSTFIPLGTRILSAIPYELKKKKFLKICALSTNFV